MEYTHFTSIISMLQALAAGIIWGVYYDVFRLFRRVIHFARITIALQDIVFWLTSAVFIFFVCIKLNNGFIRIYFVVFALVGWTIYFYTLGKMAFAVFDLIISCARRIIANMKSRIISIISKIYIKIKC